MAELTVRKTRVALSWLSLDEWSVHVRTKRSF